MYLVSVCFLAFHVKVNVQELISDCKGVKQGTNYLAVKGLMLPFLLRFTKFILCMFVCSNRMSAVSRLQLCCAV